MAAECLSMDVLVDTCCENMNNFTARTRFGGRNVNEKILTVFVAQEIFINSERSFNGAIVMDFLTNVIDVPGNRVR